MSKRVGYMVFESCEDYEQGLTLRTGKHLPAEGILDWCDRKPRDPVTLFPTRADANAAIIRTEHYRLAFERGDLPERKLCVVVPLSSAPESGRDD